MGASATEGTGPGSASNIRPLIKNGVVKNANVDINALNTYKHDIYADGNLTVDGTTQLNDDLSVFANTSVSGWVRGGASGQLVNTYVAIVTSGDLTTSGSTPLTVATINYTPVSSVNVNLFIEFHADYSVSGSNGDAFQSFIKVDGTTIALRTQSWGAGAGQSNRSGVLFPIAAVHNQTGTSPLAITIVVAKYSGDDTTTIYKNGSDPAAVRISEYIA